MNDYRVVPYTAPHDGDEWICIYQPFSGYPQNLHIPHAEFKRACCEAFGLVDPGDAPYPVSQDMIDEMCRVRMAEKTRRDAEKSQMVFGVAHPCGDYSSAYTIKKCGDGVFELDFADAEKTRRDADHASEVLSKASRRMA